MPTSNPESEAGTLYRWAEVPEERLTALLSRRVLTGERMMVAQVYLKQGCIVPLHHHEHEQISYVLSGALRFRLGEEPAQEVVVRGGEVLHIPSGVPHQVEALEDTVDVDLFSPPREDWLNGTDAYLRTQP